MKPENNSKTNTKIKLGKTFFKIEGGKETIGEAVARKKAEREAAKAELKKKGITPDKTDPFMGNFGR